MSLPEMHHGHDRYMYLTNGGTGDAGHEGCIAWGGRAARLRTEYLIQFHGTVLEQNVGQVE